MPGIAEKLTVSEFETRYRHEKPYYEFWRGEAIQKEMPTWIHGLLQRIVMELLTRAGFRAASEVKLKIDPELQLIPDVIATRGRIEPPYPLTATEIIIEILSDDDSMSRMLNKCRIYQDWGFEQIYVVDPAARMVFRWVARRLEVAEEFAGVPASEIWVVLDRQLQQP